MMSQAKPDRGIERSMEDEELLREALKGVRLVQFLNGNHVRVSLPIVVSAAEYASLRGRIYASFLRCGYDVAVTITDIEVVG